MLFRLSKLFSWKVSKKQKNRKVSTKKRLGLFEQLEERNLLSIGEFAAPGTVFLASPTTPAIPTLQALQADLEIQILDFPDALQEGQPSTFKVSVTNKGPNAAADVSVQEYLNNEDVAFGLDNLGAVQAGEVVEIEISFTKDSRPEMSFMADVVSATNDPNPNNNAYAVTIGLAEAHIESIDGGDLSAHPPVPQGMNKLLGQWTEVAGGTPTAQIENTKFFIAANFNNVAVNLDSATLYASADVPLSIPLVAYQAYNPEPNGIIHGAGTGEVWFLADFGDGNGILTTVGQETTIGIRMDVVASQIDSSLPATAETALIIDGNFEWNSVFKCYVMPWAGLDKNMLVHSTEFVTPAVPPVPPPPPPPPPPAATADLSATICYSVDEAVPGSSYIVSAIVNNLGPDTATGAVTQVFDNTGTLVATFNFESIAAGSQGQSDITFVMGNAPVSYSMKTFGNEQDPDISNNFVAGGQIATIIHETPPPPPPQVVDTAVTLSAPTALLPNAPFTAIVVDANQGNATVHNAKATLLDAVTNEIVDQFVFGDILPGAQIQHDFSLLMSTNDVWIRAVITQDEQDANPGNNEATAQIQLAYGQIQTPIVNAGPAAGALHPGFGVVVGMWTIKAQGFAGVQEFLEDFNLMVGATATYNADSGIVYKAEDPSHYVTLTATAAYDPETKLHGNVSGQSWLEARGVGSLFNMYTGQSVTIVVELDVVSALAGSWMKLGFIADDNVKTISKYNSQSVAQTGLDTLAVYWSTKYTA